jgi:hypothetical protein
MTGHDDEVEVMMRGKLRDDDLGRSHLSEKMHLRVNGVDALSNLFEIRGV